MAMREAVTAARTPTEYAPVAGAWSGLGIALRLMDADAEPVILALRRPSGLR